MRCFTVITIHLVLFLSTQWLKYCATNRKVAESIPDGVFGVFH
jgi:hypothetical protein